jgi:GGDEF domain-containing protein
MLADVLLQRIKTRPFQLRGVSATLPITLSVGVACSPSDARDGESLIHRADAAPTTRSRTGGAAPRTRTK